MRLVSCDGLHPPDREKEVLQVPGRSKIRLCVASNRTVVCEYMVVVVVFLLRQIAQAAKTCNSLRQTGKGD